MSRKMLINVLHPEEARVAIVQEGLLMELNIEISGKEQTKGNIYKGVVVRVEPGLQAAFVDIGQKKPGFIQMGDLHPDSWQWREGLPEDERKRRPRIQDVLRRGQELIVQVEKDARDMKGCALTSYLSLPGRYMVLMPGDTAAGISRKIEDNTIRKELKSLVAELQVPEGYGYIVRTEAVGRTQEELRKDLEYLIGVYERIRQHAATIKGAGEVYQDAGVILRTIRDYFSDDIDDVLVDDKAAFQQAVEFFKEIMPGCEGIVKLHREKRPIFSKYQLEEQIDQLYEKRVPLPSGGSLVIEPTEALVSIDVNSGKSSGERGVEDTAFKTNMEAAAEVARQLRLRDLGGLVVIDFIDMRDNKHNKEVEQTLKDALKADKARMNLGRISQFGMMEMSRQRIAKNINDAIHLECPHCEGRGRVKSVEAMALSFLRKVHGAAAKGQISEVRGGLPLEVAYFLLNRKKRELAQIENDYEIVVTIKGKPSFLLNQLELEVIRKEKVRDEIIEANQALLQDTEEAELEPATDTVDGALTLEGSAKKRRKRKRKKKSIDRPADALIPELIPDESGEPDAVLSAIEPPMGDSELAGEKEPVLKKRRRSRARKKSNVSPDGAQLVPSQEDVVDLPPEQKIQQDTKPTRSPRNRRTKQVAPLAVHSEQGPAAVEEIILQSPNEAVTEPVAKKRSAPRQKKVQQELTEKPSETVSNDVESKPRKRITSRSKKVAVVPDAGKEE